MSTFNLHVAPASNYPSVRSVVPKIDHSKRKPARRSRRADAALAKGKAKAKAKAKAAA